MNIGIPSIFLSIFLSISLLYPQDFSISKIEPPNWWIGMQWDTVQLMVYGQNLKDVDVKFRDYGLVGNTKAPKVLRVHKADNPSFLFIDVEIPDGLKQDDYELIFSVHEEYLIFNFPIYNREFNPESHQGFTNEDVIYLVFADRFCDGNPSNNAIGDSLDEFTSDDLDGRKGGDIEGIISKLDYLKDLGITAIWITPMLENNMWMSYHGYAATNLYRIDPRFGSNELYKKLVGEAHKRRLKIILDHVSNHIGINHFWVKNSPAKDWINGSPENFIQASHDKMAFLDIHGDSAIINQHQRGWFTDYMPDLNQQNPFLKKYLIQNTLWWIEYSGIDGIREDTYPYCDQKYLSEWAEAILKEYPEFNIVGEVWQGDPPVISGYQSNSPIRKSDFDSNLPVVTDFAFADAVRAYLSGEKTIYQLYNTLAQDFVYADPNNLLVFFDNHDIERAMFLARGNVNKLKVALNLLLFTRGIPVIFYGTEIGLEGGMKHGELRHPFPGGFTGDVRNAFTKKGRNAEENDIHHYLSGLLKLRFEYPVLSKGKLRHVYQDSVYYIIKTLDDQTALIIINTTEKSLIVENSIINKLLPNVKGTINMNPILGPVNFNRDKNLILQKFSVKIFTLDAKRKKPLPILYD